MSVSGIAASRLRAVLVAVGIMLLVAFALLTPVMAAAQDSDDDAGVESPFLAGPAAISQSADPQSQIESAGDPVPTAPLRTTPPPPPPQRDDYAANEDSEVFGAQLFTGAFAAQSPAAFNAEYAIGVGDQVQVRLWGAFNFQSTLSVDEQGNIFLPNVGPVNLLGVPNGQLQTTIEQAVRRTFRSNVYVYARLAAAQPVRVYVGGFVNRPGAYAGTNLDSVLHYLDMAGGIDPLRGSFLNIVIKRGGEIRAAVNLYDFLLRGEIPQVQFADGDVIFVGPRGNIVEVEGRAANTDIFEFTGEAITVLDVARMAKPEPDVTNVRIMRTMGETRNVDYYSILEADDVPVYDGNVVTFTADKRPGTISVRVEGEHLSPQEYVLPYGTRLGDVLEQIEFSPLSARENISLSRESVRERQRRLLNTSLDALEQAALTARSGTREEGLLRAKEAELLLQWVDRARSIEPRGQVVISQSENRADLLLENGDVLRVPARDGIVIVSGEVQFPNAMAFDPDLAVEDYVARSGGFTNNADKGKIIVLRQDGTFAEGDDDSSMLDFGTYRAPLEQGDEILVMPRIDTKNRQIFKEVTQILYQIAVSAGVVLGL